MNLLADAVVPGARAGTRDPFVRQAVISLLGIVVVTMAMLGILFSTYAERRVAAERDARAAVRDSAMHARLDTAYALALRIETLEVHQQAKAETILTTVLLRSAHQQSQIEAMAQEQRLLMHDLVETLRREIHPTEASADTQSAIAP